MSINSKLRKRVPAMLLSLIMVFTMILPGLSVPVQAASSQPLVAWNVTSAAGVSGTNADATSGTFQSGSTLQLIRDSVPYTVSYTSGGVQAGAGGTSAASNLANMADNAWWVVNLSSAGYENITVEWRMRSTNTGPRDFKVQYSTDGAAWYDANDPSFQNNNDNGSNPAITAEVCNFTGAKGKTLPSGADDQSTLYVRWLLTSNVSVNGGSVADGGTNTINNIVISGTSLSSGGEIGDTTEINILTFNDFHGQVEFAGSNPGAARFAACMNYLKETYPNAFAVAGGDNYQGSAVSNYYLGKPVSDMIKAMGVEYSSLGNHEFDWGYEKIPQFAADGNIDFICSNLFYKGTDSRPSFVRPYAIQEIDGKKIGIVGFIVTDTPVLVKAEYAEPFDFRAPGQWLTDLVDTLKNDFGCDAVIALSHDGNTNLVGYGLAGVINGHSHAYQATTVNGTAFVQAGYNGRAIGRLQLVFDNETGACTVTPSYVMVNTLPVGLSDAGVQEQIDWYLADSAGMFDTVVGQADVALPNQSVVNDWATRLVYDFIERQTGTPYVVIQNSGGWRSMSGLFLEKGDDITYRWLTVLMPFDNEIVLMDLSGNYLIDALNGTMAGGSGSPVTSPVIAGAYKQGSNWYLLDGTMILPSGTYKVSCNDFMLTGGDSYDMFKYGTGVQFLGDKLRDALADEIAQRSGGVITLPFAAESLTLQPGANAASLNFNWYSDRDDNAASVVKIAKKNNPSDVVTITGTVGDASASKSWHKASVNGLARDTEYTYRVSNDGVTFSEMYSFKTGAEGDFQFIAVGDPQLTLGNQDSDSVWPDPVTSTKNGWQNTLDMISQYAPDAAFIAGTGDQVDTQAGLTGANQATVEAEYSNYFAPDQMSSLPVAPAAGNHELTGNAWPNTKTDNFNWHFNLPNEKTSVADFNGNYWYTYNNALFVVLNTAPYPTNAEQVAGLIAVYDAVLAEATAANPGYQWLFVQHHKTTASPASHQTDADVLLYAPQFNKLMDDYKVDFVLAGHDHVYSRSWVINDNKKVEADYSGNSITNPQGTIYFTFTTASGLKYYDFLQNAPAAPGWVSDISNMYTERKLGPNDITGKPWYTNVGIQVKAPQFTSVDVTDDSVTFKTCRTDTMAIIDEYTIIKTDAPPIFAAETLTIQPGTNATAMNFDWYSDRDGNTASVVQIAKKADMAGDEFPSIGVITTTNGTVGDASAGKSWHKAGVTGLAADTEYVYRVSNDGTNFSKIYSFKTSAAGSFSFAVTGDPQLTVGLQDGSSDRKDETTAKGWQDTLSVIAGKGVDFIAGVGDQVDMTSNGSEAEYANFFAPDEMTSLPYAPAIGNHDRHYLFNYHYNLPNEQSFAPVINSGNATNPQYQEMEVAGNYYYLYNNALFVVLNDSGYPESKEVAAQYIELFDRTLKTATLAYAGQYDWLFVQHHKATASVADHCADRDIQYYVEAGFEKLMDEYSVDFVLAGHDHVYARSYPMYNGLPDKTGVTTPNNNPPISGGDGAASAVNPNGTVYFTTTTASGLKYYELFNNANNLYVKDNEFYPYLVDGKVGSVEYMKGNLPLSNAKYLQDKTPGYLYVEVNNDTVTFSYYDLDEYANTPYDTYTVRKVDKHAVTFNADNGTVNTVVTVNAGDKVSQPATPVKAGFTFSGWYNGEIKFDFNTAITTNVTLTAKWTKIEATLVSAATTAKDFISIVETSKNSRIWTLTFNVTLTYSDGAKKVVKYSIDLNGNNANLDGTYKFPVGHDLAGYTLVYDIKGNGSNIKDFRLTK